MDAPGHQVARGLGPFVGHMDGIELRALAEQKAGHVRRGANAGGGVVDVIGPSFGELEQLGQALDARHTGHHRHWHLGDQGHGLQIALGVVGQVAEQGGVDGNRPKRIGQQGVAVGRCTAHDFGAQVAGRPGAVFHHDGLAPAGGELNAHLARQDVGGATGGERDHQLDRFFRVLGPHRGGAQAPGQGQPGRAPSGGQGRGKSQSKLLKVGGSHYANFRD